MIQLRQTSNQVFAVISKDSPVTYLSTVLQNSTAWLLCHGINKIQYHRQRQSDGNCILDITSLDPTLNRSLNFTSDGKMSELLEDGYLPPKLAERWESEAPKSLGTIDRVSKTLRPDYEGVTVIQVPDLRLDVTVNRYAMSISEQMIPFLMRGCTLVKHQVGVEAAQIWFNFGMDQVELAKLVDSQMGYDPRKLVGSLGTKFDPNLN